MDQEIRRIGRRGEVLDQETNENGVTMIDGAVRLDEIMGLVGEAPEEAWQRLPDATNWDGSDHYGSAVLRADVRISMRWGRTINESFVEPWITFPDKTASSGELEVCWNGVPVFSLTYVSVDGARCKVPLPHRDGSGDEPVFWITQWERDFFEVVNAMSINTDYARYVGAFEIRAGDWQRHAGALS